MTGLFQQRGGAGGRSRNGFAFLFPLALACAFSRRVLYRERDEAKERADPRAALIAALRNSAGASPTIHQPRPGLRRPPFGTFEMAARIWPQVKDVTVSHPEQRS